MDKDPRSPISTEPLHEPLDWTVLGHLEDLEQELSDVLAKLGR